MPAAPDIWPAFAWDGGRRVAFAMAGAPEGAILTLIAHGPETSACIAVWEAAAGMAPALLPDHALHLDLTMTAPGAEPVAFAMELDSQLQPAMADLAQDGLRHSVLEAAAPALRSAAGAPEAGVASLNLASSAGAGLRLKVGPLVNMAADDAVTTVTAVPSPVGLALTLARPNSPSPVLAALVPANPATLADLGEDVTGASGADAAARGFRMIAAADGVLDIRPFGAGDRVLLLAPRHHRIAFGENQRPGTRLALTGAADGSLEAELTTLAYRPATSTALAALSGGSGRGLTAGGGGLMEASEDAAALAEALWKRQRLGGLAPSGHLAEAMTPTPAAPMAKLTLAALRHPDSGVAPLTAAVGAALGLPPALVEEIEALPAPDRSALAQWAALSPEPAAEACRARVVMPPPTSRDEAVAAAARAANDSDFSTKLIDLADRLSPKAASSERRAEIAMLREIADPNRADWIGVDRIVAARELLALNPAPAAIATPTARMLADLKRDARIWTEAQLEARGSDLAVIGERRALIPIAAMGAALPPEALEDLEQALPALSAAEIVALHRHLDSAAKRHALLRGVKLAIIAMDEAAGSRALASRMDRSGDPLVGMTRIGSASEPVVRELLRVPQAREALVALTGWIAQCVPAAEQGHAVSEQLVRNLKSYGCFLLMNAITAECRTLLAPATDSAAAFATRLSSGLSETLPRFAAAAAARGGDDLRLGLSFTNRLPSLQGTAAT
jgi:hypothetical protein